MPHSELDASQISRKARRKQFAYDVFLSHNAKDKPAVRELAECLKQDGLRVWFDEWVIQPGDSIPLKIEQGLEQSRTLILVMSQNAFTSEWVTLERHTVLFRDPTNAERSINLELASQPEYRRLRTLASSFGASISQRRSTSRRAPTWSATRGYRAA